MPVTSDDKIRDRNNEKEKIDFEAKQNLLGFFELLLNIDMRNNPELYKEQFDENYENNRNTNYTD